MHFNRLVLIMFLLAINSTTTAFASEKTLEMRHARDNEVNEDNLLLFNDNTPRFDNLSFNIDPSKRLRPKANDFELTHYAPMSNKLGERWVLVTVKNTSSGHRFLKTEYMVATFGNAEQTHPLGFSDESVGPGEFFSQTIFFGINKFPIVMLEIQP